MKTLLVALALVLALVLFAPAVAAGPLPLPNDLPYPLPEEPQDEGHVVDVDKILEEFFSGDTPVDSTCLKTEERSYEPDEYPGQPVTVDESPDHVKVQVWNEGTVTTIKVTLDCLNGPFP